MNQFKLLIMEQVHLMPFGIKINKESKWCEGNKKNGFNPSFNSFIKIYVDF